MPAPTPPPPTERQRDVLRVIDAGVVIEGAGPLPWPPTYREIAATFGMTGTNGVACHVRALERKGLLWRIARVERALRLTEAGKAAVR